MAKTWVATDWMKVALFVLSIVLTCLINICDSASCVPSAKDAPAKKKPPIDKDSDKLENIVIPDGYQKTIAPRNSKETSVQVRTNYHLKSLKVNTKKQEISFDMVLGMSWIDERLKISNKSSSESQLLSDYFGQYVVVPGETAGLIWIPDIYLEKTPIIRNPIYMRDASSIRFYTDGRLRFTTLLNFDTHCEMVFHYFPFDKQVCYLNIVSFGHTIKDLVLTWEKDGNVDDSKLGMYSHTLSTSQHTVPKWEDMVSKLVMRVSLKRNLLYYMLYIYIPSILLATVSYCSLYLPPTSKVPRIGMTLLSLLSAQTMSGGIAKSIPNVAYITLADAVLYPLTYYCFICLWEFLIVQYLVELEMETEAKIIELCSRVGLACIPLVYLLLYFGVILIFGYRQTKAS